MIIRKTLKYIEKAIDMATDECIVKGILEQILRNNRGEVHSMILTQYDEQAHIEYEKELSFEEGQKVNELVWQNYASC